MATEIEAKMAVSDLEATRAMLRDRGAMGGGRTLETNVFFDTKDRSLLAGDRGLRLRTNHDVASGVDEHVITYKGPRQAGLAKSREEVELAVPDPAAASRLFESLGFRKTLTFEKRRESWMLGGCKIELDELPRLGSFVEVEGPDEPTVLKVRESLGLSEAPMIQDSYIAMLVDHLAERGQAAETVTFADTP